MHDITAFLAGPQCQFSILPQTYALNVEPFETETALYHVQLFLIFCAFSIKLAFIMAITKFLIFLLMGESPYGHKLLDHCLAVLDSF
jgi:hypothetical protein